ncbi:uncharacterized protein LOC118280638 isoform X16 [Spodoptera frugiperda]|uniref:Uncharacterized protein LOC118280638 isoform X11 n=1 Tax=Spodoptera frugiperda TaxID=7108 RepID=A0A9R0F272_SPOFR|nr:uncharacterized protein LOC118280638 isoform X4 [Spodoptera frugiperda]XP_050557572.1 uncharacterized protein LOC118280638 isoform X5 [Spodoptera frugiperda]XP_050557573.1 uncharacterized protein LOC118280638 isoform X6 [Spodoptera frugiperda]XP_050557574.1 uncharacterized protein LOC118280638 isoform X7 [Spodoptera frugiperda]XP_050557575.1 uncharacterized protein LOC118280638 isoform X8 [Spodoptera frugiperda]XP_050557576.1 uncharacterized protein LOC118280638 isoform X9 [Spodoptera frugi
MGFRRWTIIFLLIFMEYFGTKPYVDAQACSISQAETLTTNIKDVHEGIVFDLTTTGVTSIKQPIFDNLLNWAPYFTVTFELENSRFLVETNERFPLYEEHEVELSIYFTVNFMCINGNEQTQQFRVHLFDTNNHVPRFIQTDHYTYVLDAPTPPGYQVTGCLSELIARDVDLTNKEIIFEIEENEFFEITYSAELSKDRTKEFVAIVTTKTFIRHLREDITLTIYATDVHGTEGQETHTTSGKITIKGNPEYLLPDEPVFSKTIYNGIYTTDGKVELEEFISLQNGYDNLVHFSVGETYNTNFRLVELPDQVNQIKIEVLEPLKEDILLQSSIALEIIAERESTSGATATVILQLPQVVPVQFESAHYEGKIEDNILRLQPLLLSQGYEDSVVSATFVENDYSEFFSARVDGNTVSVSMEDLDQTTIDQNSFIYLQIVATARSSTATAVITLEIIKDDNVTPVFDKPIYTGTYDLNGDLTVQPIRFTQGYDGVESVELQGDHKEHFKATRDGSVVTIEVSNNIPVELFDLGRIVLSMEATKPRTVGAKATLIVTLPTVVPVQFQSAHYEGKIEDNILRLQPLLLSQGYEDSVVSATFVENDYSEFFSARVDGNTVSVSMEDLDQTTIDQNSFIYLQIVATARSSTATAVITLEIIKDDNVTPVFDKPIYTGTYDLNSGLTVQPIRFTQGYDGVESVELQGDHKEHFKATREGSFVTIEVSNNIPVELFDLGRIVLSMGATKPRTVGAKATLIVTLPTVVPVQFQSAHYEGKIEDNILRLQPLLLSQGYEDSVVSATFVENDYSEFFSARVDGNTVTVSMEDLDQTTIDQNSFIYLQIVATARSSTATAVITLEIIKDDNVTPVFDKPIYTGTYDLNGGLTVQPIRFTQGYDGVESVELQGDHKEHFKAAREGSVVTIEVSNNIPVELFDLGRIVLSMEATKPRTVGAKATLIVTLPTVVPIQFQSAHYEGKIEDNILRLQPLLLSQGYEDSVVSATFVENDYSEFFSARVDGNTVTVSMEDLDQTTIDQNSFIYLQIVATARSSTATAVITLEIIKDDNVTPVFDKPIYTGSYDPDRKLIIEQVSFSQGYEGVDSIVFHGDHKEHFKAARDGSVVTIEVSNNIPVELFDLGRIVLSMEATKPRTVGAKATLIVTLPTVVPIQFQSAHYEGKIEDNILRLQPLLLSQGYEDSVVSATFVENDYSEFFSARVDGNTVTVSMEDLDQTTIDQNSFIYLQIVATARSSTATAVITLEIIKDDNVTPVFDKPIYTGSYDPDRKLIIEQVSFSQGYEGVDSIVFHGEHARYFTATRNGADVAIELLESIPPELFNLGHIVLSLQATKPRTVGANTAVIITLPAGDPPVDSNVSFDNLIYEGTLQDNVVQHENIRIFEFDGTTVDLRGDYSYAFEATVTNGLVSVTRIQSETLPAAVPRVTLELHARSARAVLLLNVLGSGDPPVDSNVSFDNLIYEGTLQDNVVQHENIRIFEFDGTTVDLRGEHAHAFRATVTDGSVSVSRLESETLSDTVTRVTLELHARSARAVLLLNVLGSGDPPVDSNVSFDNLIYEGTLQDNVVQHENIRIFEFDGTTVDLRGEHAHAFRATVTDGSVSVSRLESETLSDTVTRVTLELHARSARAVLLLNVLGSGDPPVDSNVSFDNLIYEGTLQDNVVQHENIRIFEFDGTTVDLRGEHAHAFRATVTDGSVSVSRLESETLSDTVTRVTLELHARSARAVLLLNVLGSGDPPVDSNVSFDNLIYEGTLQDNVVQHENIRIFEFDGTTVDLRGEHAHAFRATVTDGSVSVSRLESETLSDTVTRVTLELHARSARAVLLLNVLGSGDPPVDSNVSFDNLIYEGTLQDNVVQHENIRIFEFDGTTVDLRGEHAHAFRATVTDGSVSVSRLESETLSDTVTRVTLELHARSARAVLLLNVLGSGDPPVDSNVSFDNLIYEGTLQDNVVQHENIRIFEFDGTTVDLRGDYSYAFEATVTNGLVSVTRIQSETLPGAAAVPRVTLELHARSARAVLLLNVLGPGDPPVDNDVSFDNLIYEGTLQDNVVQHDIIRIFEFDGTTVDLRGDYSYAFEATVTNGLVSVTRIQSETLPGAAAVPRVTLELHARSARAVLLLNVLGPGDPPVDNDVSFDNLIYEGTLQDNVVQHDIIRIFEFDGTTVDLRGDYSYAFEATVTNGLVSVTRIQSETLPGAAAVPRVTLELHARSARAVLLLNVLGSGDPPVDSNVSFDNLIYEGTLQDNVVQHENIRIFEFDGTTVDLRGEHAHAFRATVTDGSVSVSRLESETLSDTVTRVTLELHARSARAVLLLNVLGSGVPEPLVEFSSESYALSVFTTQTGIVGRVSATANNNEAITYSFDTDNAHLLSRLSINNEGELHLSAPVDSGVYTFQVIAVTVISQARATAPVHLTSHEATVCDDRGIVVPPLIVIDRDEEEEHRNLVVLDPTQHAGCRYTMTNRWPTQQSWLYVDETGLHTNAIDREHESIAFMTVSQVQVELILECDDDPVRTKRSKRSYDWLDPYEYGSNKWVLTDSIPYNSRRTLVNLIVNDINDNAPIFIGKENEPIVVGYPNSELEERILPRSLVELQATDADIGINAALRYSSSESVLAVAPSTGFVHVRSGASLQQDQILTVTATDQNGEGLSGTIQLAVKLLDVSHIAVVTVRDVFLDDEKTVLSQLSDAVGYEVKALRSVVVSDDINEGVTRHKRETNARTSLQLYVYGLVEQEPVVVTKLTSDLNSQAVIQNVATIPLEAHLDIGYTEIQSAVGLLVATIILSVLLFAALCVIGVWFFLRWRKNRDYDEFRDDSSVASRNASLGEEPKPEEVKPRMNLEDLKKSEKRLQELLAAPMEEVTVEPMPRRLESPVEARLELPVPQQSVPVPDHSAPIAIQLIDKLKDADDESDTDEFGESSKARRKSVVTFNENVEKIIHVQDDGDESEVGGIITIDNDGTSSTSTDDVAVYRL